MSDDIHHLPGRLRIRIPALRTDETLGRMLARALRAQAGVEHIDIRAVSGSMVLHYDPGKVSPSALVAFVKGIVPGESEDAAVAQAQDDLNTLTESLPRLPKTVVHLGRVFGHTAFKVALQRVVETGLTTALRTVAVRG